ncbi:MAG TPA: hypothetical protein VKQ28_14795 [Candidatus Acidoferrum sp.]|nr:hypothetical protein [Candidatus Acidoferrum sp.]
MLLATIVLLGAIPQSGQLARSAANVVEEATSSARELPSMPKPKAAMEAEEEVNSAATAAAGEAANDANSANAGGAAVHAPQPALAIQPIKAAYSRPRETRRQRIAWYTLAVAGHGAAAFDAYTTRLALSGNYGVESNPLLRPFAHSNALYAVTQVSPAVMDYIGKRMMVSENPWLRKLWWVPQAAGSGFSVFAGTHNLSVVR